MTGYGRGEASINDVTVLVELRSVNNRFRDLQLRCPREYMALEPRITQVLKEPFHRGRIDAFVRRSVAHGTQVVQVDPSLADQYLQAVGALQRRLPALAQEPVSLDFIVTQPGVLIVTEAEVDVRREWQVVETALLAAIQDLLGMREREGQALAEDLERHLTELRGLTAQIEAAAQGIIERLQARLESRLARLLDGDITVQSALGTGSVFTCWLPVDPSPPMQA